MELTLGLSGLVTIIDDEDAALVQGYTWRPLRSKHTTYVYAHVYHDGRRDTIYLHCLLAGCKVVDHKDRDGLNNRRENLRPGTRSQNMANRRKRKETRYRGVTKRGARWRAKCGTQWVGTCETEEEAARLYDAAALERWGEFARLNFPQGT